MGYKNYNEMLADASKAGKRTVAVAAAHDAHALEAVKDVVDEGLMDYILVGDRAKILEIAAGMGFAVDPQRIVDAGDDQDCAKKTIELVRQDRADLIMKGILQTSTLLKAVVNKETGIGLGGIMSHMAVFQIPNYHKLLAVTDGGMVLAPDLEQKVAILNNAVRFMNNMGVENPKVAVLCPVETVNPKLQSTVDAAEIARMNSEGEIKGCVVAGPISYDLTMSKESAAIKKYTSPVTGDADILLTPDMNCGNIVGKILIYSAGAEMAGCILGAKVPIVLTSRGASAREKMLSLVMAAVSSR